MADYRGIFKKRMKVYVDSDAPSESIKAEYELKISNWMLCGSSIDGNSNWWWYNGDTDESRKYCGEDIKPEDCPIIENDKE